jgi:hypothetical protein
MILLIKIIFLFDQKIIKIDIHMKCKKISHKKVMFIRNINKKIFLLNKVQL